MSTKDQAFSAALHGQALLAAQRPELQPLIDHLREVARATDWNRETVRKALHKLGVHRFNSSVRKPG